MWSSPTNATRTLRANQAGVPSTGCRGEAGAEAREPDQQMQEVVRRAYRNDAEEHLTLAGAPLWDVVAPYQRD